MHIIFQRFIDSLSGAVDPADFQEVMTTAAEALDLPCFAYLALQQDSKNRPRLFSTYPQGWTSHYLRNSYERIDPIVKEALRSAEPFQWGIDCLSKPNSPAQQQLLDEASHFGIRFGFTVPIHDGHGPVAALTFAMNRRDERLENRLNAEARVLQLMAMYFHAHVRRKLLINRLVGGVCLSPRELECLQWASQGKSTWEIGQILGISRNTVADYLDNAKGKLGVRTVIQATTHLAAAIKKQQK